MRAALLCAALALGACGPGATEGSSAYGLSPDDRDFRFEAASHRVLFVRGTFPNKSYVGSLDLSADRLNLHRSAGRKIIGLPAGRTAPPRALFSAAKIVDEYAGEAPKGEIILEATPGEAGADRSAHLDGGRHAVCLLETAWSDGVLVAAASADRGTTLGRWRSGAEIETVAALPSGIVDCVATPNAPRLGLLIRDDHSARFDVWDAAAGRRESSIGLPPEPAVVGRAADGRFFAAWHDKDAGLRRLAALDAATGALTSLYASSATIASAAALPSGLLLLVKDERAFGGMAGHLKPQSVIKLSPAGRVEWTRSWSRLPSRLVGFDPSSGRVLVAIQDPEYNALWAVPLEEPAFGAAVERLERETSPIRRRMGMARNILLSAAFVVALLLGLYSVAR